MNRHHNVWGILLIVFGGYLLLAHWFPSLFGWHTLLIALGVALFIRGVRRHRGAMFSGTLLFLLGLFFMIKELNVIWIPWRQHWPLVLLMIGVSFIMLYIFDPARRGPLWAGVLLLGLSFFLLKNPYDWDDLLKEAERWWPLLVILLGVRLIWQSAARQHHRMEHRSAPAAKGEDGRIGS